MSSRTALAAALLLGVTGCTLSSSPNADSVGRTRTESAGDTSPRLGPAEAGAPTIEISAPVEPKYDKTSYTAEVGALNIRFSTTGNHNVNLVGPGIIDPLLWGEPAGAIEEGLTHSVELARGTYLFYCSVQGHRAAGMQGTIRVR